MGPVAVAVAHPVAQLEALLGLAPGSHPQPDPQLETPLANGVVRPDADDDAALALLDHIADALAEAKIGEREPAVVEVQGQPYVLGRAAAALECDLQGHNGRVVAELDLGRSGGQAQAGRVGPPLLALALLTLALLTLPLFPFPLLALALLLVIAAAPTAGAVKAHLGPVDRVRAARVVGRKEELGRLGQGVARGDGEPAEPHLVAAGPDPQLERALA